MEWLPGYKATSKKSKGLPASWETCMQVKKQQLELYMEKQTS